MLSRSAATAALLWLAAASLAAALRSQQRPSGAEELQNEATNPVEADHGSLDRVTEERARYEQELVREYEYNLSHAPRSRSCESMRDKISALVPLVVPELKLAFCYIPKAACSEFKDLFNTLNRIEDARLGFGLDYMRSTAKKLGLKPSQVTRKNGWKFAIFTRDPALRYLSAWGSTCVSTAKKGIFEHSFECCGPLVTDNSIAAKWKVDLFQKRLYFDAKMGYVAKDDHWVPQVHIFRQCGWEFFNPQRVDFHGDISDEDVNGQVKEMLSLNGPIDSRVSGLVDRFFPKERIAGHKSPVGSIAPEMFFNNETALKAIRDLYAEDFDAMPDVGQGFTTPRLRKLSQSPTQEAADKED